MLINGDACRRYTNHSYERGVLCEVTRFCYLSLDQNGCLKQTHFCLICVYDQKKKCYVTHTHKLNLFFEGVGKGLSRDGKGRCESEYK